MIKKTIGIIVLLVIGLLGGHTLTSNNDGAKVGGTVENFPTQFISGLQIGNLGVVTQKLFTGTVNCTNAVLANGTVAANATTTFDCAVTGVRSGDKTIAELAVTAHPALSVYTSYASTTASNYLEVGVYNSSSTAAITLVGATSSVDYIIAR